MNFVEFCLFTCIIFSLFKSVEIMTTPRTNDADKEIKMKRGALIVLEGCDRCGKTTQSRKLLDELSRMNIRANRMFFPDRTTPIGKIINQYLTNDIEIPDKAVHLLFSANRWELEPKICDLISNGTTLVIDRYSFSGVAYSTAKHNMDVKWCWQMEIGLPKPDLVLFMQSFGNNASHRNNFGEERYENEKFQEKVFRNFLKMKDSSWKIINADDSIDTVHSHVMKHVKEVLANIDDKPLLRFT